MSRARGDQFPPPLQPLLLHPDEQLDPPHDDVAPPSLLLVSDPELSDHDAPAPRATALTPVECIEATAMPGSIRFEVGMKRRITVHGGVA